MKKQRNKFKQFEQLTKEDKERVVSFVTRTGMAITKAATQLSLSAGTINKVLEERFKVPTK